MNAFLVGRSALEHPVQADCVATRALFSVFANGVNYEDRLRSGRQSLIDDSFEVFDTVTAPFLDDWANRFEDFIARSRRCVP